LSRTPQARDIHTEDDPDRILVTPEGVYSDVIAAVSEDEYRQMRQGYMCSFCLGPWHERWPKKCPSMCWLFGNGVTQEDQHKYMDETYGETWLGISPGTKESWENVADRMLG
jgi:hypothetical protein